MPIRKFLLVLFLAASAAMAQKPVIGSVQNAASNILSGLPNYGTAKGQIFVIYGTNLGPATIAQASSLPLPYSLGGTTVTIGLGGASLPAPILYSLSTQVAAIMPSNTPPGNVTVQVTYNATASTPFSTPVVATNFGIFTLDQTGANGAVITDVSYAVVTPSKPAVSGRIYTMWGTGLGAANSDNNSATNGDLGTPIQVYVGGLRADVSYRGRSSDAGLDQINFTIPAGVTGCAVSLAVQTTIPGGSLMSNITTLPISADGSACSDANGYPVAAVGAALTKGSLRIANLTLDGGTNQGSASFLKFSPAQWTVAAAQKVFPSVSLGSCKTTIIAANAGAPVATVPDSTGLDAGPRIALIPPFDNPFSLEFAQAGIYRNGIPGVTSGTYLFSGSGGNDVPAFSASFAGIPSFGWTNSNTLSIDRTKPFTVTWGGGDADSYVEITGRAVLGSFTTFATSNSANFECQAPASAGSFTIPAQVLLTLPAASGNAFNGTLVLSLHSNPRPVTIPGVDVGLAFIDSGYTTAQLAYK